MNIKGAILSLFVGTNLQNTLGQEGEKGEIVIYRKSILNEGINIGEINIIDGIEPADSVYAFAVEHKLNINARTQILNEICVHVSCTRRAAIVWKTPVSDGNKKFGEFELLDGVEPVDAAHKFVTEHKLNMGYRNAILKEACDVVQCQRIEPVIWKKDVNINGSLHTVAILEGQEPADVFYNLLSQLGVDNTGLSQVLELSKKDGIPYSRDHALLFSQRIEGLDGNNLGIITFYNDLEEPVDVLYKFAKDRNLMDIWDLLSTSVLNEACNQIQCKRRVPIVWRQTLNSPEGNALGALEIFHEDEPIDRIDDFLQRNNLGTEYRNNLLQLACEKLLCQRETPIVFRKSVQDDEGQTIGSVEIMEEEEVIDAVVRFIVKSGVDMDTIALKNYFFNEACDNPRVKCTRNIGNLFESIIRDENGTDIAQLTINENEQPVDAIYNWCILHGLDEDRIFNLIHSICDTELIRCTRFAPIIFGPQSLTDGDGISVGFFQVLLRQEPIDALYAFFSRNGLHGKWDLHAVLDQLCALPGLDGKCKRRHAMKYFEDDFMIGDTKIGPVAIWEHEEVADKIFQISQRFNISFSARVTKLNYICQKEEVYCSRIKAIVHQITDINKNDYAKFGNETCLRRYAGWQYLSSVSNSKTGEMITKAMKKYSLQDIIEYPLIGPSAYFSLCILAKALSFFFPKKFRQHYQMLMYLSIFFFISLIQAFLIEPTDEIDQAMHSHEGALPNLIVYEGDEPVDALMKWGKEAAKKHHPIIREPIYNNLLNRLCNDTLALNCTRLRAWEEIDLGHITQFGQEHIILYNNPEVDPIARYNCDPIMDGKADTCIQYSAKNVCERLSPIPNNCVDDITLHMSNQLKEYNDRRHVSKRTYIKLGLEMDAPTHELFEKSSTIAREHGQNVSPYKRVDNGTAAAFEKWDDITTKAYSALDAFHKVKDPESRQWEDKPCEPLFGGAMCAKTDKDGNMQIEC